MAKIAGFGDIDVGPNLRPLLVSNEIMARNAEFARKSSEAVAQQTWLIRMLGWINTIVLAVAVLSGTVLAAAVYKTSMPPPWPDRIVIATGWVAGLIGLLTIIATVLGQLSRDGDRLGRWRSLRAEAEAARSGRFTAVARAAAAKGQAEAREALDLVRVGLLEDQRAWYVARAHRHRDGAKVTSGFSVFALLLTAFASAASLVVSFSGVTEAALLIGVLAAAFSAYAADRDHLYRDRSNADLYERTAEKLGALAAGSDKVQAEIEAGNPQAVVVFADLVTEELQTEHKQWAASLDVTSELLARLEQRLQQARAVEKSHQAAPGAAGGAAPLPAAPTPAASQPAAPISATGLAATLAQWRPLLAAASVALPPPHAERARLLLAELTTLAMPLDSAAPASSAIAAAQALIDRLRPENPLGQWFRLVVPGIAPVLGTVFPPLTLALGIAGVGAKLGEAAYRRWVAKVLQTPFSPGLVEPPAVTSTMAMAALEVSPVFAASWAAERTAGDLAALTLDGRGGVGRCRGFVGRAGGTLRRRPRAVRPGRAGDAPGVARPGRGR